MSWIKENKFIAVLGGGTLVGVILLYIVGSQGSSRYAEAKEAYDTAANDVKSYEKGPLYPKMEYKAAKSKALQDYKKSLESLQEVYQPFHAGEIKNMSPQEFTNRLLAAKSETTAAFKENGVKVPEAYFVGFGKYKTTLASESSTGVLDVQLGMIKGIMLDFASARPTELKNLHRPDLPEESGKTFAVGDSVARAFPLEITFSGTEKSVREFLSTITKPEKKYVVIRTLRITNMKKDPPKASDARFEKPVTSGAAGIFGAEFVLPGDDAVPAGAPAPEAAPKEANSARILSQVLGTEELQVFVRLDVLQFLPAKKLP